MKFKPFTCPKCGTRTRAFKAVIKCSVPLEQSIFSSKDNFKPRFDLIRRLGKTPEIPNSVTLICGGGHEWEALIIERETHEDV